MGLRLCRIQNELQNGKQKSICYYTLWWGVVWRNGTRALNVFSLQQLLLIIHWGWPDLTIASCCPGMYVAPMSGLECIFLQEQTVSHHFEAISKLHVVEAIMPRLALLPVWWGYFQGWWTAWMWRGWQLGTCRLRKRWCGRWMYTGLAIGKDSEGSGGVDCWTASELAD